MSIKDRICRTAFELLKKHPEGIRYAEFVRFILSADSSLKQNTVHGTIWDLDRQFPDKVYKPSRGMFRLIQFQELIGIQPADLLTRQVATKLKEEDFYPAFVQWLLNDVEECTEAISLGGNRFRDKWGTPDVIGKRESKRSDIIKAAVEVVSAEIKLEVNQLVTAFGQACAYCLFSHKSYLVVPKQSPEEEIARLDALCQVFGIGLVLFDACNSQDPKFDIRVRPRKQEPDMFYVNKYMKFVEGDLFK